MNYIKNFLEEKVIKYNNTKFIDNDPIKIPHLFYKQKDIEISALLTALISWGTRKIIIKKSIEIMKYMDNSPYDFIINHTNKDLNIFKSFKHRTFIDLDIKYFIISLKNIYKFYNGLSSIFYIKKTENNTQNAIKRFRKIFLSISHPLRIEKHISNPDKGSVCKKLNMFLRWMSRKDNNGVDFGLWDHIPISKLSCPIDIHSFRVSKKLGLISNKNLNIKSLIELDNILRFFDKTDPVKYDFALFGLGVFENF